MAHDAAVNEKPLNELLTHSLVDIYVGPDNHRWPLHEKLLTTRSTFFAKLFRTTRNFGLPDDSDEAFALFVGWLYSDRVPAPREERDLTEVLELALMGERWAIAGLVTAALETVRDYYTRTDTYPGLRRVQYVYANTEADSPVRAMMVGAVARMLVLQDPKDGLPLHWEKALRRNGQLAVDVLLAIQGWRLGELLGSKDKVPDPRKGVVGEKEKEGVEKVEDLGKKVKGMSSKTLVERGAVKPIEERENDQRAEAGQKHKQECIDHSEGDESISTLVNGAH